MVHRGPRLGMVLECELYSSAYFDSDEAPVWYRLGFVCCWMVPCWSDSWKTLSQDLRASLAPMLCARVVEEKGTRGGQVGES